MVLPTQAELLDLAMGRVADASQYWNFYIVAVSAVIVLLSSGRRVVKEGRVRVAVAVTFVLFAIGNLYALLNVTEQRAELVALVTDPSLQALRETLRPQPTVVYAGFHVILDLVVIIAILAVPWPVEPKGDS